MKEVNTEKGRFVMLSIDEYRMYKDAYDSIETKKQRAREYANSKYKEKKLKEKEIHLRANELTDEEVQFILKYTN